MSESKAVEEPAPDAGTALREERPSAPRRLRRAPTARFTAWDGRPGAVLPPVHRDAVLRRSLAVADLVAVTAALLVASSLTRLGFDWIGIASGVLIVPIAKVMGRYDHDELLLRKSTLDEFPAILALAAAFALTWSLLFALTGARGGEATVHAGGVWALTAAALVLTRGAARFTFRHFSHPERVLIVGNADPRERLAHSLGTDPGARLEVVGFLPLADERRLNRGHKIERRVRARTLDDLSTLVEELRVERVFVALSSADAQTTLDVINRASAIGVKVSIVPSLLEVVGSAVEFDNVGGVTLLGLRRPGLSRSSRAIKRGEDIVGACFGLILTAPLLAVAAVAIKLDSEGPVLFRQSRVGRDGREFAILKFRSMYADAEARRAELEALNETEGLFKLTVDPRVTRVGQILRKASIDELPQLFNVLRGEMSLVGPRPLVPAEDVLIEGYHRSRLTLAPGMTGPWQILGPIRPPLSEMAKTDYLYAANWSLWTDLKLLVRTFAHVSSRRGL